MDPLSRQKPGQCPPKPPGASSPLASLSSAAVPQQLNEPYYPIRNNSSPIQATTTTEAMVPDDLNAISNYSTQYPIYLGEQLSNSEKSNSSNLSDQFAQAATAASNPYGSPFPLPIEQYPLEALTDERWQLFLKILYSLTALTSFILNIITVIVLARSRGGGTTSQLRKYLINLSVSDLLMSMFSIPFEYTEYMLGEWIFGGFLCPVVKFIVTLSVFVSAATMTVIGINRYLAVIVYPSRCQGQSGWTVRRKQVIFAIWTIGIIIASPEWLTFRVEPFCHAGQYHDDCRQHGPDLFSQPYAVFIFLSTFFIPLVLMSYLYGCIGLKLWRRQLPGEAEASRDLTMQTQRLKVIKMLCVVVALFAFSWLPMQTFSMVQFLYPSIREINAYQSYEYYIFVATFFVCHWLSMAHSCLNPLILYLMNEKFRSDLQALIMCKRAEHFQQQQQQYQHQVSSWQSFRLASCKAAASASHSNCSQAQLLPVGHHQATTTTTNGARGRPAREVEPKEGGTSAARDSIERGWAAISLRGSSSLAQLAPANSGGATLQRAQQPTNNQRRTPQASPAAMSRSVAVAAAAANYDHPNQPAQPTSEPDSPGPTRPDQSPSGNCQLGAAPTARGSQLDQNPATIEPEDNDDDAILRQQFEGLVGSVGRRPLTSGSNRPSLFAKVTKITTQRPQTSDGEGGERHLFV